MSWLYTIVFAGLAFSSHGGGVTAEPPSPVECPAPIVESLADETERFEKTYQLNANGRISVSNVNGSIVVEAWDKNEVRFEYTKIADTRERLADVEVEIESQADRFSAETNFDKLKGRDWNNRGGKLTVEFKLWVPRGAVLNEIETVNGSVTVSNFTNITRASAVNGSVNATNLRGTAKLSTVNGEVKADFDRLEVGSKVALDTVNGRVNLTLPSDANATVRAESLNGNISNDFGLTVRKGKYVGRDLYGKLGAGEVAVKLESVNGNLAITKRNDGRQASPVTNLLPPKEKDEDWDTEFDVKAKSDFDKANKHVAKAVKQTQKTSAALSAKSAAKAMADVDLDLELLQPDLARLTSESVKAAADSVALSANLIKSEDIQRALQDIQTKQSNALARMSDASFFPTMPRIEKRSESFPVKGVPKVTVTGRGCSVTVRGWDRSEVQYRVTQFADARARQNLNIKETHTDSAVNITVENPLAEARNGMFDDDRRVTIEVFVPRKADLKIDANGTIRLDGVSGELQIVGADEKIDVRDSGGKLTVSNSDGQVRIIGFRGDLVAKTVDGDVRMDGDFNSIIGNANDGSFILTVPQDLDAEISGRGRHGFTYSIEDVEPDKKLGENLWRFGSGSKKYRFQSNDGTLVVQNRDLIEDAK